MARQSRANPATLEGANSSPLVGRSGGYSKPASADGQGPLTLALRVRGGQDAYLALNLCSRRRERGLAAPPQRRTVGSAWLSHYSTRQFCLLASRGEGGSPQGGPAPLVPFMRSGRPRSGLTSWLRAWAFPRRRSRSGFPSPWPAGSGSGRGSLTAG